MIKATELRIGNYVGCKMSNDSGIYTVAGIDGWRRVFKTKEDERIYHLDIDEQIKKKTPLPIYWDERLVRLSGGARNDELYPDSKLKGIKLTEEWLLKFGFKKVGHHYSNGTMGVVLHENGCLYAAHPMLVDLFYVHQLQNLYYSLTHNELIC